jgi:hypothetical protein
MSAYCSLEEAFNLSAPSKKRELFRSKSKKDANENFDSSGGRKTYGAQTADYKYMCESAGICVGEEQFKNSEPPAAVKKCERLTVPNRDHPFTDEEKARFKKAIKIALEEMTDSPLSPAAPPSYLPRSISAAATAMVGGDIDEELESYMMINDMKSEGPYKSEFSTKVREMPSYQKDAPGNPFPFQNELAPSLAPALAPAPSAALASAALSPAPAQTKVMPENFTKKYKPVFDLLLFIVSGIIIILIMEQLFKLAMMRGMNRTLVALEKIIDEKVSYQSSR